MTLDDIPLFATLKSRLGYLNQREQVIAQNVANSDSPGYTPRDLQPFTVPSGSHRGEGTPLAPVRTHPAALSGTLARPTSAPWRAKVSPDSETQLSGNQVVLEEQMMKMADARLNYATALGLYQKSLSLMRLAIKAPGKP